jgi:RHS repeat-associated protein
LNYTLDAAGNIIGVASTLPYGQLAVNTTGDNFLFTDHERDAENGTDATLYRHYASTQGRWLSPDPSNGSYNLADPQSLNRYAYLTNRPMAQVDRLGLDDDDDDWGGDDDDDGGGWWGGWDFSFSFSFDGGTWSWDGGGGPGSTGTTEPGGAPVYAQGWFYAYGTPYGIGDTPYVINDNSPGLDRDGMADFPLAQALFHGGGQPYWGAANKVVTYATVGYAGAVLAAPLAPAAVAAASATATAMSTATTVVTNSAGYAYGYMQGALATGSGVLLGKYISENENYMLDAEEAGLGYFNIGKAGWNIMSRFGNPLVANQGFLDSVLNRGVPIYLGSQPVSDGSFAWELQYLFSQGVSNGELIRHW